MIGWQKFGRIGIPFEAFQVSAHLCGALIADIAIFFQRLADDAIEFLRQSGIQTNCGRTQNVLRAGSALEPRYRWRRPREETSARHDGLDANLRPRRLRPCRPNRVYEGFYSGKRIRQARLARLRRILGGICGVVSGRDRTRGLQGLMLAAPTQIRRGSIISWKSVGATPTVST